MKTSFRKAQYFHSGRVDQRREKFSYMDQRTSLFFLWKYLLKSLNFREFHNGMLTIRSW